MDEKENIKECYKKMYQGMINKDRKILSEILDDSFVLIHLTGMRQSKKDYIRAIEDGTLNYYSAGHQNMEVQINGEKAVLIGKSMVNAAVFGGGRHTWRLQQRMQLIKKEDKWHITEAKASTY